MSTKAQNQSKFMRFITLPFRALGKAKDLYVRSVMDCAPKVSYGSSVAYQPGQLPKSYSSRSCRSTESEDFRELVKAASVRSLDVTDIDAEILPPRQKLRQSTAVHGSKGLPKSCSVGMGRIDEDSPYDLEDGAEEKADLVYSRSRSYAVTNRRAGF